MNTLLRILGGLLAFALSACAPSTLAVATDYDPATNFTGLKTYDWEPLPDEVIDDPKGDWKRLSSLVQAAADNELSAKGFTRQTTGSPDFLIQFHTTLEKSITSERPGSRFFDPYYKRQRSSRVREIEWEEVTLVLDLIDPETQKYIWTGFAAGGMQVAPSPEKKAEMTKETVKEILKGFPPK